LLKEAAMADPWCFFSALSVWRNSVSRRRAVAESPWLKASDDVQKRFVFARVAREAPATINMFAREAA
jgi:hypothetical protein